MFVIGPSFKVSKININIITDKSKSNCSCNHPSSTGRTELFNILAENNAQSLTAQNVRTIPQNDSSYSNAKKRKYVIIKLKIPSIAIVVDVHGSFFIAFHASAIDTTDFYYVIVFLSHLFSLILHCSKAMNF